MMLSCERTWYVPTPEEIAQKCAEIRSRWTTAERRRRCVCQWELLEATLRWQPPVIKTAMLHSSPAKSLHDP